MSSGLVYPRWAAEGAEPAVVCWTWSGGAFHAEGPRWQRTRCGRVIASRSPWRAITTDDYCRRCFGSGGFRMVECGVCGDMGAVELPELLPCPACRPVEHTAESAAGGLPVNPSAGDHPNGSV